MRKELNEEMLDSVNGGRVVVNGNLHKIAFRDAKKTFQLKNCSDFEALALCNNYVGKYSTEEEFDNACIEALRGKGWI